MKKSLCHLHIIHINTTSKRKITDSAEFYSTNTNYQLFWYISNLFAHHVNGPSRARTGPELVRCCKKSHYKDKSTVLSLELGFPAAWGWLCPFWRVTACALFQYPIRRLVRSRKVSKPRDLYLELSDVPVKFQSDVTIQTNNLAASKFHEILR